MQLVHGGDWAGFETEYGRPPLDFSANVSPLGVPEAVQRAVQEAVSVADRYPDPLCRKLRQAIGETAGISPAWVLCGNGAADLIWRLAAAVCPREALIPAPTFAEYEAALNSVHCRVKRHSLLPESNFAIDESFVEEITTQTGMVFLCEPNNPTGRTTPVLILRRILDRCTAVGALLVVDECFMNFLDDPAAHTLLPQLKDHPNLVILKAFTKLYAMAGIRLGYALCSDETLLERMRLAGPPWSVSTLAQEAGCAALGEKKYVQQVRALIRSQRILLRQGLERLGLRVIPGEANYLLFRCTVPLLQPLRGRGILLRGCGNYLGLDDNWYRTAVRTEPENRRLLAALEEILA